MNSIKLNFLETKFSSERLRLYMIKHNEIIKEEKDVFHYRLPDESGDYYNWKISLNAQNTFQLHEVGILDNYNLTTKLLYISLLSFLRNTKDLNLKYESELNNKTTVINFIIDENKYGQKIIFLIPYFLRIKNQFGFLIDYRFRKNEDIPLSSDVLRESLSLDKNLRSNKNYYSDKYEVFQKFLSQLSSFLNIVECFGTNYSLNYNLLKLDSGHLEKRTYIFRNKNLGNSQFQGLVTYGPVKRIDSKVKYLFLFENKYRTFANELYLSLIGKLNPGTFPGLEQMFGLNFDIDDFIRYEIKDYSENTFDDLSLKIQNQLKKNPSEKLIGIFIEPGKDETPSSPYFRFKYLFTKNGVPLQVVAYDKLGDKTTLKWSTANVGLQIFSKLGGVPWLVKPSINNCLILGIGSAHERKIDGSISKYLAYAVCLDSSGLYQKLDVLATGQDKTKYFEEFKLQLKELLNNPSFAIYEKCVIHVPFKIKRTEIESIFAVINELKNFKFRVIKININNKFFGFSDHNTRIPYESSFLKISKSEYVVWFEGLLYGKENVARKVANPVHIEFIKSSDENEQDINYLQDVINLSGANWRGFNSKLEPISIYYPRLIAHYAKIFEKYPEFDKSVFKNNLPWFL